MRTNYLPSIHLLKTTFICC